MSTLRVEDRSRYVHLGYEDDKFYGPILGFIKGAKILVEMIPRKIEYFLLLFHLEESLGGIMLPTKVFSTFPESIRCKYFGSLQIS